MKEIGSSCKVNAMVIQKIANATRKRGIGILEVMVAALVLGILYAAVSNLQKGNREALLRIRGRDGATEVAQNIIDSLGMLGPAYFTDANLPVDEFGNLLPLDTIRVARSWEGQPGLAKSTMTVNYKVIVTVSRDEDYRATTGTFLDTTNHVFAKRLDVKVTWPFKNSTQSIIVTGVIR